MSSDSEKILLSVREVIHFFGMSRYVVYELIKSDPSFPCLNVGPKKNFRIRKDLLEDWLNQKIQQRQVRSFRLPSFEELLQTGRGIS